jgi:hypothetical protein
MATEFPDPVAIAQWAQDVGIAGLLQSRWGWPTTEIFHFFGLCLLFGTVGFFDLRMLGVARGVSLAALQTKLALMLVAGVNMVLFYVFAARLVAATGADDVPPLRARIFGTVSLLCWLGVITCGRVITAYRPPHFWCFWC